MPECPMCHHVFEQQKLKCNRCDHEWIQRGTNLPKVCPQCKSPYWNKERVKQIKLHKTSDINEGK